MNEGHPNENKQKLFIQSLLQERIHHHLCFAETQKQAEGWESFKVGKIEDVSVPCLGAVGVGKL